MKLVKHKMTSLGVIREQVLLLSCLMSFKRDKSNARYQASNWSVITASAFLLVEIDMWLFLDGAMSLCHQTPCFTMFVSLRDEIRGDGEYLT